MGLGDIFKAIGKALGFTAFFIAFSLIGPASWGAALLKKAGLVFGSTLLLSAFANQRPNFDLPDVSQSVYGTNEPAKTIYGEAVTGGLVCDIVEEQVPSVIGFGNDKLQYLHGALCRMRR